MFGKPLQLLVLFLCIFACSACGYLDEDIWLDEEQYSQTMHMEGLSISGSGHSYGCGGGILGRRARLPRLHGLYRHSLSRMYLDGSVIRAGQAGAGIGLTDEEILNSTDIEVVDESVIEGSPAEFYNDAKDARDAAVLTHYTSGS